MGYRVKGTLKLPDGTPGTNCEIEFTSRKNFTPMLTGMGVSIRTDSAGAYDVTLEYGAYAVILRTGNTYPSAIGQLTVGPDTVAGQDLPTLLEQSGWQPATPEYIKQITEWLDRAESAAVSSEASAVKSATDGAAQAAIAKLQADRAKSEADRASKISGLDTVSDAVALAALPLPDVWAPLSDSLRLITGYGRDVLVGSDVVARMVNFSRNSTATYIGKDGLLKTAAANEPRFEKEGLLLEGQSTNLVPWSEDTARWSKNNSPTLGRMSGVYTKVTPSGPASGIYLGGLSLTPGRTYTFSFWGYADAAASVRIGFGNEPSGAALVSSLTTTPTRYTKTFVATLSGDALIAYGGYVVSTPFYVGGFQIEELPFASSYIPTNGAAGTLAADVATLPQSLNLGEIQLGFSLAVEFDSVNTGGYRVIELSNQSSIILDTASLTIRHAGREVYGINAPLGQRHHIAYSVAADGAITVALNGKLLTPQSSSASYSSGKSTIVLGNRVAATDRPLHGHLRDLKIWTKKPLTADQLKVASA